MGEGDCLKHFGKELGVVGKYCVIDCERCGFIHLNPIPTKEYLKEFYEKKYYCEHQSKISEMNVCKQDLEKGFWELDFKTRLNIFKKFLPELKELSVFDIGCGTGLFLECADKGGWRALGLDPSAFVVKKLKEKGLRVLNKTIEEIDFDEVGQFDVVHLRFVLEHYHNPLDLCRVCYKLLKVGGVLCVEVPNDFSAIQKVASGFLANKKWWLSTDHINYFSSNSLRELVKSSGLNPVYEYTNFPMEFFLLMGLDYVNNPLVGKTAHKFRMAFEEKLIRENNELRIGLYEEFAKMGIGRSLILLAKKGKVEKE